MLHFVRPVLAVALALILASPAAAHHASGQVLDVLGEVVVLRAHSGSGAQRATVVEITSQPGGGPPLHVHDREDEIFYIVEGSLRIWRGNETLDVGPGGIALMPRGVPHTYKNISNAPARAIVTITPDGLEGFFEEVSRRKLSVPKDVPAIDALAEQYGMKMLGPPPGT
jgi:quercetin dioxygenase-like cupin family protein